MPLNLSPSLVTWLTSQIHELQDDVNEPGYLRLCVSRHHVLPLAIEWTGFWGLRADGEILFVDTEDGRDPVTEEDERLKRMALFQGAKRYKELEALLPERPDKAWDCPNCLGTGRIEVPGVDPDVLVCYCGGFGWLV
jgi:hypothetical protein